MDKLKSTKVQLAWFFATSLLALCLYGSLSGSEFILGMTTLLGIFSTANVLQKKVIEEKKYKDEEFE